MKRHAFTLVELLVVITILVLLIALLVPAVARARDYAKLAVCRNNMSLLGKAGQTFAGMNDGRGPGKGQLWSAPSWASSVSWANILDKAIYNGTGKIQRMGTTPGKNTIYCPSMVLWGGNLYPRAYKWNNSACSDGSITGDPMTGYVADGGTNGKVIDRPAGYYSTPYVEFLGVVLMRFPNPSWEFLASEGERGNDNCPGGNASPPFTVTLNGPSGGYPPWANSDGQWAFRHMLPNDESLYPEQARGTFLFVDGHVDAYGPLDPINDSTRFAYRQK